MKITTNLKDAKQVALAIANAPAKSSKIMLADSDDFYVTASANNFKGGFAIHVVRRSDRSSYGVAGFKGTDIKKANLGMDALVKYATDYIAKFMANQPAALPTPVPAASLTQLLFEDADMKVAQAIARHLGYPQTAYTSSSALIGLHCLAHHPGKQTGCVIKTKELGFMFVSTVEDLGLQDVI